MARQTPETTGPGARARDLADGQEVKVVTGIDDHSRFKTLAEPVRSMPGGHRAAWYRSGQTGWPESGDSRARDRRGVTATSTAPPANSKGGRNSKAR